MAAMQVITGKRQIDAFIDKLKKRAGGVSPEILRDTERILERVKKGGDRSLRQYTRRFDGHSTLRIPPSRIRKLAAKADKSVVDALKYAAGRIRRFHKKQKEATWSYSEDGIRLGQIIRPLQRVGVYVPGGTASYPSTVLMNIIPAQVAGVPEIAVAVPTPEGKADPNVMAALDLLGIDEVYSIGGAQAVAAFAYGTKTIKAVDKIAGPGNIYVATAKRMVFGTVDIDMIAGPSEILVIADNSAPPSFVAADLLSQAEHDPLASSVLITDSASLAKAVDAELKKQISGLSRKGTARSSLKKYGAAIVVKSLDAAADIANTIAPEHLEIMTRSPRGLLPKIRNAGAIFLGRWSLEPIGDYVAGPNHTLPTGGTSRWASPLGVYDFFKRSSLVELSKKGFLGLAEKVERLADAEGLGAHSASVKVRHDKRKK